MKTTSPDFNQIEKLKMNIRHAFKKEKNPELPFVFLNSMMELGYSGHFELAMKIATESWPSDKPGLLDFKSKFTKALLIVCTGKVFRF